MCEYVDGEYVTPGWGCCGHTKTGAIYNGMIRKVCKACGKPPCEPLTPDRVTGRVFENRKYNPGPGPRGLW